MRSMAPDTQSVVVRADLSAFEFREAAWAAADPGGAFADREPDPSSLSDRALAAALRYEDADLPRRSFRALEEEWSRRSTMCDGLLPVIAFAVMALLGAGGIIAGWVFFSG
jgi:hypothetical protein